MNVAQRSAPGGYSGSPLSVWVAPPDAVTGEANGTSVFDPVLTELLYRWFCPPGGLVLDPFAGGSVRGIVAAVLGYRYVGFELRPEQVAANRVQAAEIVPECEYLTYHEGDSALCLPSWPGRADFLLSCPPYGDLEVYSDLPGDLSAMPYEQFLRHYRLIIAASAGKLRPDRFAAFVVSNFRDTKTGFYRNLVGETVAAFEESGIGLYNEAVILTAVGSLPARVAKQWRASRKLGRTHQNVLIFCKGNPRAAAEACRAGEGALS